MHLLYLDESGDVADPNQHHFVLAGVAVFERKTHWIEQSLNKIAARFAPEDPYEVELHGSPMRAGREGWKRFPLAIRLKAIQDALCQGVSEEFPEGIRLFGAVIRKSDLSGKDPVENGL